MSKKLTLLIDNIPGPAKRYCHLQLRSFNPNSKTNVFLNDFVTIATGKNNELKSHSTRLYEKILDILFRYYESDVNNFYTESHLLQRALVLNKLGLHHEASIMCEEAIQLSIQDHNYVKYFEAFDQRLLLAFEHEDIAYLLKYISFEKEQKEKMLNEYSIITDYQTLWTLVKKESLSNHFFDRKDDFKNKYYKELLARNEKGLTAEAKIILYKIKGFFCMKENKYKEALEYMLKTKEVYQQHAWLANKDPLEFAKYIKNTCIIFIHLNEFKRTKELLKEFETEINFKEGKIDQIQIEIQGILLGIQTDVIIQSRNFEFDLTQFASWEKFLLEHYENIPLDIRMTLTYAFFLINLHLKNLRKCKKFINLINSIHENIRKDIREFSLIGELTLHLIEGNLDLMENRLKTFENKIKNEGCFFSYTPNIISYFRSALKGEDKNKLRLQLKEIVNLSKKGDRSSYANFDPMLEL